jgi:4-hydroxybenzoate polyprenyltransferase
VPSRADFPGPGGRGAPEATGRAGSVVGSVDAAERRLQPPSDAMATSAASIHTPGRAHRMNARYAGPTRRRKRHLLDCSPVADPEREPYRDPDRRLARQPMSERLLYALKPGSWPKLLVSAALGQGIGVASTGAVDPLALALGLGFTLLHLACVVLLNDWGDQDVDAIKRRLYPTQSSPKTIPDGILDAGTVVRLGVGAGLCALACALTAEILLARPGLAAGAVIAIVLFWAYSLPPVRLNYRGGGELLEMLGVGFLLPWWNAYLQSGSPVPGGMVVLPGFALMCLASALASGLADVESDRLGGKRTFATAFGPGPVRQAAEGLVLGAILVWAALPWLAGSWAHVWMMLPPVAVMAFDYRELRRASAIAESEGDELHRDYKVALHDTIWRAALILAGVLVVVGLVQGGIGGR